MINEKSQENILEITEDLLKKAGFDAKVKISETSASAVLPVVSIESEQDLSILIGKNGQNLTALEHLVKIIANKKQTTPEENNEKPQFILDINDYRRFRTNYIIEVARTAAQRVLSTQKAEALVPMNAYERRLVHTELTSFPELQTESIGEEPRRRVVVKLLLAG